MRAFMPLYIMAEIEIISAALAARQRNGEMASARDDLAALALNNRAIALASPVL